MSIASIITQSGYFTVGGGAQYPVLNKFVETETPVSLDGVSTATMIRRQWTIETLAIATADNTIHTLRNTVMADLAKVGAAVDVRLAGGANARTMAAGGGSAGSVPGYPKVSVTFGDSYSGGRVLSVKVVAETITPIVQGLVSGFNLVEHDYSIDESVAADGEVTIRRSGRVRVRPDQVARTYIDTLLIDDARTAAETAGDEFSVRYTQGLDASEIKYDYTINAPAVSTGGGVIDAEVVDVTTLERAGRVRRTISGSARGPNASTYAAAQEVAGSATLLRTSRRISSPRVTDGRVDFAFEYVSGSVVGSLAGASVVRYAESIDEQPGDRKISAATYLSATPALYRGDIEPFTYTQVISCEFFNSTHAAVEAAALFDGAMSNDNMVGPPRISRGTTPEGTLTLTVSRAYMFATQQTIPSPRKVEVTA